MKEKWLPIAGTDRYEVSDQGRVRSKDMVLPGTLGGSYVRKGSILYGGLDDDGYRIVTLRDPNLKRTHKVHHLVLETFVGPRPAGTECRHLNNIRVDARLVNLKWGTKSRNNLDRVAAGTHQQTRKTHCNRGHELRDENLMPWFLEQQNKRICLSCNRARSYVREHPELDMQVESDRYYKAIQWK